MDRNRNTTNQRYSTKSIVDGGAIKSRVNGGASDLPVNNNPPDDANSNGPVYEPTPQDPTHTERFTVVPPNPSRHSKLKMMAQKEEEELQRYKEANRPGPIHLNPERLGGAVSLVEARERQRVELRQSKLQKKLKMEEMERKRRQEEEEEIQRMKAKQREKADKLEEKKVQEEQLRREQQREIHYRTTDQFLQRFERTDTLPVASSSAAHTSSWVRAQDYREDRRAVENAALQLKNEEQRKKSEALEERQRQEEKERRTNVQQEHRQVNAAFLDRLQGQRLERQREMERPPMAEEVYSRDWEAQAREPQDPPTPPEADLAQGPAVWAEEADADYDWVVMKLQARFLDVDKGFLKDIVIQCSGDYLQACQLLEH
ncbi:epithelial-stromal interaction protein 1 isoform X2 [Hypomesus transpacificus]|uniref:epithelial-stromal interaction protein 1 isoform X2 n=1 Tax=Hypomesus transpacificus TaxID=137520 RepID=UPI001F08593A|nr:epithelial-stromal interaction protein 1 isoform X2 [Hypomesus transpacificus]